MQLAQARLSQDPQIDGPDDGKDGDSDDDSDSGSDEGDGIVLFKDYNELGDVVVRESKESHHTESAYDSVVSPGTVQHSERTCEIVIFNEVNVYYALSPRLLTYVYL